MQVSIYILSCPISHAVKYIGQTNEILEKSLINHIANPKNNKMCKWINKLKKENLIPIIEEIDSVDESQSISTEKYWIEQLRVWGFETMNVT